VFVYTPEKFLLFFLFSLSSCSQNFGSVGKHPKPQVFVGPAALAQRRAFPPLFFTGVPRMIWSPGTLFARAMVFCLIPVPHNPLSQLGFSDRFWNPLFFPYVFVPYHGNFSLSVPWELSRLPLYIAVIPLFFLTAGFSRLIARREDVPFFFSQKNVLSLGFFFVPSSPNKCRPGSLDLNVGS